MPSRLKSPLIVALDIGTSSTRALLYDSRGRLQPGREVQIKYEQTYTADGGVECDADSLFSDTMSALSRLIGACDQAERARIAAVASSCFWHALLGVDRSGKAVTPLYSWADTRSRGEVDALRRLLDPDRYHERTGAFIHSCFWPAKIMWLRRAHPDLAARVARYVSFPDYMAQRLCGRALTSISIASATGLTNDERGGWDMETLAALGIATSALPEIAAPGETFRLAPAPARLAALADVAWHPAYGDGACSNIGAGGVNDCRVVVNVSTSGAVRVLCPKPVVHVAKGLFRYRMDERRWIVGGAMSNGGNVYAWLEGVLKLAEPQALERALRRATPDGHGLTVLPFWAGERSPGWHAVAEASIVGLNLSTTAEKIAQASLESVAYTFRSLREDILRAFPKATQIIASGGAVEHSRYMQHLLANVLDAPVRISLDAEPSGRGAALAVAERIGALSGIEQSPDRLSPPIAPDPAAAQVYGRAHARFEALYNLLLGKPLAENAART